VAERGQFAVAAEWGGGQDWALAKKHWGMKAMIRPAVVGYNGTFVATEPMRLALLAVGYADGLDRAAGNRFSLLVRGQRAPLVGRVSMDQAVVDVTEIDGVGAGDEVVILGQGRFRGRYLRDRGAGETGGSG
jgi:alanine racemase